MEPWLWHSLICRRLRLSEDARNSTFSGATVGVASSIQPRMSAPICLRPGLLVLSLASLSYFGSAQAIPAASRLGDIQVGVGYVRAHPDYSPSSFDGFTVFGDADLWRHLGVEADFHRISGQVPNTLSETTYEFGGRYRYPIGPLSPYVKLLFGAGTFSFGNSTQNGTFGIYSGGGGIDFLPVKHIVLRADFEYQRWGGFPPRGLQPNLFTVGAAYRFR